MAWLPLGLLLLSAGGAAVLLSPRCLALSERDRHSYGWRPLWQTSFDALSAACGVGLLTCDLEQDYTELGRWTLLTVGLVGAWMYLAAARQVWSGLVGKQPPGVLPGIGEVTAAFIGWQAVLVGLVLLLGAGQIVAGEGRHLAWNTVSAFASLGWLRGERGAHWVFAAVGLLGALGWPVWLLRRHVLGWCIRPVLALAMALLVAAGLITAFEVQRKALRAQPMRDERLAGCTPAERFHRALVQAAAAAGGGLQTENLEDRAVGEGTKFVLAGLVLAGGLGGASGGGIKWPLILCVIAGSVYGHRRSVETRDGGQLPTALAVVLATGGLWLVTALGLLLIENWTGSAYRLPPTLADALLESASAVGGAGLTSGLTSSLSAASLSSGIRQPVDLYQYGMGWLMLAMLAGRVVPLLVLARAADGRSADWSHRLLPPL